MEGNTGSQYLSHQVASVLQRSSLGVVKVLCQVFYYRNALLSTKEKHYTVLSGILLSEMKIINATRHVTMENSTSLPFFSSQSYSARSPEKRRITVCSDLPFTRLHRSECKAGWVQWTHLQH